MILVITAVEAERDAVRRGVPAGAGVEVTAVGVGPAAAAAGTAWHLTRHTGVTAVLSAGIAGGLVARIEVGALAVATRSVAADLGADGPDGLIPLDELGFGPTSLPATALAPPGAALSGAGLPGAALSGAGLPGVVPGAILTVSTVTGTAARADALAARYPDAVAEGMEGFGVATACALAGVPFAEVRAISNAVGPRDRGAWRIREALDALAEVGAFVATLEA